MALNEPCKTVRKILVESVEKRYGEVIGWKADPSCGCTHICRRKARIAEDAKQTDYGREKVLGGR